MLLHWSSHLHIPFVDAARLGIDKLWSCSTTIMWYSVFSQEIRIWRTHHSFIHAVFKNIRTRELRAIYLFFQSLEFPSLSLQYSEFYGAKLEASINSTLKYATSALNCWNIFSILVVSLLPPWLPAQMSSCRDYLAADQTSTHPFSITSPLPTSNPHKGQQLQLLCLSLLNLQVL